MYNKFFRLTHNPFDLTPDPAFLFPTQRHNEALAALHYGARRHKGFVVLTGEIGTGKTLLLRCLLQSFKQSKDVAYAYVFNGRLSPVEFLQYVVSDLGLPASGKNKSELLQELGNYVVSRGLKNLTTVLIVDEAHHLSADILEEIRLLTNLETTTEKLLQVLLVGQPELDQTLDSFQLRQLKQRVTLRTHLLPLSLGETKGYVERRLHLAGANFSYSTLFPDQTISAIYHHSRGVPRVINTICESSLIVAYTRRMRSVTKDIIDDIVEDLRLDVQPTEAEGDKGIEETGVRRAVKIPLDLFASPHKRAEVQDDGKPPVRSGFLWPYI